MEQYKAFSQERCDIANNQMYICQLKSLVSYPTEFYQSICYNCLKKFPLIIYGMN